MSIDHLLSVQNLVVHFTTPEGTVKAVDGVTLEVMKGEVVGLVGESGCGKSTLAFSILRLLAEPPAKTLEGRIIFNGKDLIRMEKNALRNTRGKEISMIFQDPMTYLNPVMNIRRQISEMIESHSKVSKETLRKRVIELLTSVNIPSPEKVEEYYPHQLSGGMLQRALIAMALSCNPSLLIADEPTTALDVTLQAQILELLKRLQRELGASILLITHDLGIVADVCDTLYVMYAGKIVERANVFDIYENPLHPYTQGLLEATLSIDEFKKDVYSIPGTVPSLTNPPKGCRFHPRCPEVMDICRESEPVIVDQGKQRMTACWLYKK